MRVLSHFARWSSSVAGARSLAARGAWARGVAWGALARSVGSRWWIAASYIYIYIAKHYTSPRLMDQLIHQLDQQTGHQPSHVPTCVSDRFPPWVIDSYVRPRGSVSARPALTLRHVVQAAPWSSRRGPDRADGPRVTQWFSRFAQPFL
jgi:hypothetical protein